MKYKKGDAEQAMVSKMGEVVNGKTEYPSILMLDEGDLKEVKDWKVGETYEVKLKIKEISSSTQEEYPNDSDAGEVHAKFHVLKAEVEEKE